MPRKRILSVTLHFDDGSSSTVYDPENGYYLDRLNWREGTIPGKVVEKWIDHSVHWTSDRVKV